MAVGACNERRRGAPEAHAAHTPVAPSRVPEYPGWHAHCVSFTRTLFAGHARHCDIEDGTRISVAQPFLRGNELHGWSAVVNYQRDDWSPSSRTHLRRPVELLGNTVARAVAERRGALLRRERAGPRNRAVDHPCDRIGRRDEPDSTCRQTAGRYKHTSGAMLVEPRAHKQAEQRVGR